MEQHDSAMITVGRRVEGASRLTFSTATASSRLLSAAASAQPPYEAERKQGLQRPPVKCTWFPSRRTAPEALGPHVHVRSASSQGRARPCRASGAARRVGFTPANATAIRHPPPTATLCILGLACSFLPPWPPLSPASSLPHPHRSPSAGVSPWRSAKFGVATNTQLHELGSQGGSGQGPLLRHGAVSYRVDPAVHGVPRFPAGDPCPLRP